MFYDRYSSPVGTLWLEGNEQGLTRLCIGETYAGSGEAAAQEQFFSAKQWLDAYFRGEAIQPDFSMEPEGTPFQKLIWQLLLEIPYGKTESYGNLARKAARLMGKERISPQAVGQAVGHNPIAIIIPCHRVVGTDGKLTGYAYGLERKAWLLNHER